MVWSCGHRSRSPMRTVLLPHRNAGRLHCEKKLKAYNFVNSGWVKPLQVLERLFRQQFWWHWCLFDEEIMTLFCANNMTSNIQHGVTSHYPSVPGEPQPRAFRGWKLGWVAPQAYRGFYNGGGSRRGGHCSRSGRQVPQWGSGAKFVPQKLKKKCEISLQLLTFSCIKFGI